MDGIGSAQGRVHSASSETCRRISPLDQENVPRLCKTPGISTTMEYYPPRESP